MTKSVLREPVPCNARMDELPKYWDNLSVFCEEMDLALIEELLADKIDYGRPSRKESIPLALLHEVFGQLVDDTQVHIPTKEDNDFMSGLREEMLRVHRSESAYTARFRFIWECHIRDFPINPGIIGAPNFATDGHFRIGRFYHLIVQGKRELD
ncbi:12992_t:CDS:2 [Acaulospora colombiana]|uniref:12992_t:CDS:1 n=1 Tax=Acaulospora colombiana TaxID=27376 RepID=A0ACA9PC42_9GLOM|nr:12992_t:CDS:2 [Acaulospora colombiana]